MVTAELANLNANNLYVFTVSAIVFNFVFLLIVVVMFITILKILHFKINKQLKKLLKKTRTAHKAIKEKMSPTAEELLIVSQELGFSADRVRKLYAEYDMRRRKVATKYLHFDTNDDIPQIKMFQKFMNESHFMKGGGFRMHRLLHEQLKPTVLPNQSLEIRNATKLPPAFTD